MKNNMQLNENIIHTFLTDHFQTEISNIEPVEGHGEWSHTFLFSENRRKKVIRFSAYDEDFKKDLFAAQFSSTHLPIPQIEEIGEAFGMFFAISPWVAGKMVDDLDAAQFREVVPALMELLIALHKVDGSRTKGFGGFDAEGMGTVQTWREYLTTMTGDSPDSRLRGWKENLAKNIEAGEIYRRGRQRLLELIPLCPEERHLVHNDLLHFNLIMNGNKVAAVIDWGCALWGDFLYDLAMFTTWQFYYPAMAGINFVEEARRAFSRKNIPLPNYLERLQCYQLHLLLDSLAYNAWKENNENLDLTVTRMKEILME